MPRNVTVTFTDGTIHVYQNAPDEITPEQASQRASEEFGLEVTSIDGGRESAPTKKLDEVKEAGAIVDQSVRGGLLSLPKVFDLAQGGMEWLAKKSGVPARESSKNPWARLVQLDKPAQALEEITGGPIRRPESTLGKYAGSIGENIVGSFAGPFKAANAGRQAIIAGMSGAGGEGAAQMTGDNPLARTAGALVTGGLTALGSAHVPNSQSVIKTSTKHMPKSDWNVARVAEKTLQKEGIPHLKSQLLGPSSTLDDVVTQVAAHPEVRPRLLQHLKKSPEKARMALTKWLDRTTEPAVSSRRKMLDELQDDAGGVITDLQKGSNKAYTEALPKGIHLQDYPSDHISDLKETLNDLAYDSTKYGPTSTGGKALVKFADEMLTDPETGKLLTNKGYINNLLKDLNVKKMDESFKGLPIKDLKRVLKEFTPEFEAARLAKSKVLNEVVSPVQKGLTGDIARAGGGHRMDKQTIKDTVLKTIFPANSPQPKEIIELGNALGPESVSLAFREYLSQSMEGAVKLQASSKELTAPFKFVQAVAGTPAQRKNIGAALHVIAVGNKSHPMAVQRGFFRLMKAFDSFKDLKIPASINPAAVQQAAGGGIIEKVVAPHSRLGRWAVDMSSKKAYNQIADIIMSPEGLDKLEAIAKSKDPQTAMAFATSLYIAGQSGHNSPEVDDNNTAEK